MRNRLLVLLASLGLVLFGASPASAADYSKYPTYDGTRTAWTAPGGAVRHLGFSTDRFRYLLVSCANGSKFRVGQGYYSTCKDTDAYHVPSGCKTFTGITGPRWVNVPNKTMAQVTMLGAGCVS